VCDVWCRVSVHVYEVKIRRGTPMRCGTATTAIFRGRERKREEERRRARERDCESNTWRRKTDRRRLDITFSRTIKIKTQFISYIHNNNIIPPTYLDGYLCIPPVVARPSSGLDPIQVVTRRRQCTMYIIVYWCV